jgi:hypothetical protein
MVEQRKLISFCKNHQAQVILNILCITHGDRCPSSYLTVASHTSAETCCLSPSHRD